MKKVVLTILVIVLLGTLIFLIGGNKKKDTTGNESVDSGKNVSTENKNGSYKTFSDLTKTQQIGANNQIWVDVPSWRLDFDSNSFNAESKNYFIIGATSSEIEVSDSLKETFTTLYNSEIKSTLKNNVERATYDDFTPSSSREETLSNGIKALKFEGTQTADVYGTEYSYPIYGYSFNYNNQPIVIMSIVTTIGGENLNTEEQQIETNKYVDEIVQTIRSER